MNTYLILLRGVNVGGKNKVPMAALRTCLEKRGYANVSTYIASGNVILQSSKNAQTIQKDIETVLPQTFKLDSELIKVHVFSRAELQAIVDKKPKNFGDHPTMYHSDAIFLMDIDAADVMPIFNPREGVDSVWQGDGVIYSQRLSAERTKSRLGVIILSPLYKSMTIRSWNTTLKLLDILNRVDTEKTN